MSFDVAQNYRDLPLITVCIWTLHIATNNNHAIYLPFLQFDAASSIRLCNFGCVQAAVLQLNMAGLIKRFALFSMMHVCDVKSEATVLIRILL